MTFLAKDPAPQGNADRAGKFEIVAEHFDTETNTTSKSLRLAEVHIRQKYGLPPIRARLIADLSGLGGRKP